MRANQKEPGREQNGVSFELQRPRLHPLRMVPSVGDIDLTPVLGIADELAARDFQFSPERAEVEPELGRFFPGVNRKDTY